MRLTQDSGEPESIRLKPDSTRIRPEPDSTSILREPDSMRLQPDTAPIRLEKESATVESARQMYPSLFAATTEETPRRRGLGIWFTAAASLVLGIVIGFASGFRSAQNAAVPPTVEAPAATSGSASPGKPFSESSVSEPERPEPPKTAPANEPVQQATPKPSPMNPPPSDPVPPRAAPAPRRAVPPAPAVQDRPPVLAGPGSLQVVSRPSGAEVIVDGQPVGRTPLSIEVSSGAHTVRLSLPGFNPWQTTVNVQPGSPMRVSGSLEQ
jgi:hypothetical protein